jgi:AGCS family alanine or glycine:cation symporter
MVYSAFNTSLGNISGVLLSISVFLFAFATIVCWGYYGKECIYFVCKNNSKEKCYYLVYIFTVFVGAYISLDMIWQIADFAVGAMSLLNLFILGKMSGEIKKETLLYINKRASLGKL